MQSDWQDEPSDVSRGSSRSDPSISKLLGEELQVLAVWKSFRATVKYHEHRYDTGHEHPLPWLRQAVRSNAFEAYFGLVIVTNVAFIGWSADAQHNVSTDLARFVFECYFTFSFVTELLLRTMCFGWTFPLLPANHLDVFLVTLSAVTWSLGVAGQDNSVLRQLTSLRILRLVRLARTLRFKPGFKEMWQLLRGLVDSGETMFWCFVMIFCVLFFFSILGVSVIALNEEFMGGAVHSVVAQDSFGDMTRAMFTLWQVMTVDSWASIMRPLIAKQPAVAIYFVFFISVSVFILMNIITAVIVENAFNSANNDKKDLLKQLEAQREAELQSLHEIFLAMDADGSGKVDRGEIELALRNWKVREKLRSLEINGSDLDLLWEILDGDELETAEFVDGLRRLKGESKAKDLMRLFKQLRVLETKVSDIEANANAGAKRIASCKGRVKQSLVDLHSLSRALKSATDYLQHAARTQQARSE